MSEIISLNLGWSFLWWGSILGVLLSSQYTSVVCFLLISLGVSHSCSGWPAPGVPGWRAVGVGEGGGRVEIIG